MKKDKQLGQGLGALLTPSKSKLEDYNQSSILISKIKPNPNPSFNPKNCFQNNNQNPFLMGRESS